MKIIVRFLFFSLIILSNSAKGQFFEDSKSKEIAQKGLDLLYNQEFEDAAVVFQTVKNRYPYHPVKYLINALEIEWRYLPIDKNPEQLKKYLSELDKTVNAAKNLYKIPEYKTEATFFLLAAYGFTALIHNYKTDYIASAKVAQKAYSYFVESKKYRDDNAEFLFPLGLYNYYRVQYPEDHPITKPLLVFFENGSKKQGISDLETAIKNALFSKVEANLYLANIYINYESNFKRALQISRNLSLKYPRNDIYRIKYVECLLLNNQFEEANEANKKYLKKNLDIVEISQTTFEGYLQEHYFQNLNQALASYARVLKFTPEERFTKEYRSMAYLGMARIFKAQNNKEKARLFYKECLKNTAYVWIKKEANSELKSL
ncbi:MAG: hypothetical protein LCH67_20045 [Bacteroidetes bacterium]|nr:hypothetical protein [Bacteroidota bacterium]